MPTKDFEINLSDELNFWAVRVFTRIKKKFGDMQINRRPNPKDGYTGDLYRTMYWEVHSAAAGSPALIKFFYMKYGDFLQWGVGKQFGDPREHGQEKWPIGELSGADAGSISHPQHPKYKAKPFLRREVTYHAKWLLKRLAEQYAYWGNLYMVRGLSEGMGDTYIMDNWIEEHREDLTRGFLRVMGKT